MQNLTIFDSLIEMLLFNIALHQPASISRVLDCKKGRGVSGTRGVVQLVQPHLTLVPSNSLLAGSVERGNEKNGSFCITLHCIAFNTLSHSISPYALQRSPPENMDHFISLCITLHHAGGLVRHWILGNERSTPKYGREPSQSQSEPHRWTGFPNQNLEYNVRQLSFVFNHQDHHCL